ncbi:hypothetical protein LINPERPRIM_LOCUS14457 [Linum perenne]
MRTPPPFFRIIPVSSLSADAFRWLGGFGSCPTSLVNLV